jgi:DNA-binding transcriptional MerR regulator
MSKPRSLEKIQQDEFVSIGELVELSGSRYSTLKYYTEIGLLPFVQSEIRRNRKYNKIISLKIIQKIDELKKKKRLTIMEILEYFKKNSS